MAKKHESVDDTCLRMEREEFKDLLNKQIQRGNDLLDIHVQVYPTMMFTGLEKDFPVDEQALGKLHDDYQLWNDLNEQIIVSAFTNNGGDYLKKYKNSGLYLLYSNKNKVEQLKDFIRENIKQLQSLTNRIDFLPIQSPINSQLSAQHYKQNKMDRVFVVHGHAEAINQEVARTIEKLGLKAIILREQANTGQTIIEKFESYANKVSFAVILLTADDQMPKEDVFRARQNVIFEMGYFMGALGRNRVMCLLQDMVEKPGDIDGVVYTPIDSAGAWKYSLIKELQACGYDVDANKIL